jgi:hypothetical protein
MKKAAFLIFFVLLSALPASAADIGKYDAAVAAGTSANGLGTTQFMLFLSRNFMVSDGLFFRVEPTVEFIGGAGESLFAAGVSATFRFAFPSEGAAPFVDLGTGINYVSEDEFHRRMLGGHVLFNLTAAGGLNIGRKYSVSYRFRHFSSADLYSENDGLNSHYIVIGKYF